MSDSPFNGQEPVDIFKLGIKRGIYFFANFSQSSKRAQDVSDVLDATFKPLKATDIMPYFRKSTNIHNVSYEQQ